MKKTLLTIAAVAVSAIAGMANEYKFVFDGKDDMGGLTRQTTLVEADLTFTNSFSLTEDGVELSATNSSENSLGYALINAGGSNAGLCVYSSITKRMTPEISLTVPKGKITYVKLVMSGQSLATLDIPFNGKEISGENDGALWSWEWSDQEGSENVTFSWTNNYYQRFIHSIDVEYTPDLGGKQECGLSFNDKSYEAIIGESFKAPTLKNPNNLEISWSSSNESAATVDAAGNVTLVGKGTTFIKAATAGNSDFAAGNAMYELEVIPSASNIKQLLELAPDIYDRVKVNFPATVTFGNLSFAFVIDSEGNAACFDDMRNRNSQTNTGTTIYSVGQVIPAGWIATNATIYNSPIWEGLPAKSTETVEVVYPKVNSVTPADADRVVTLKNVTFEKGTAIDTTKAYGTTPDGTTYEFQDTYGTPYKPAGTYDVTGVVKYSKRGSTVYFYIAPLAYSEPSGDADDPTPPTPAEPTFPNEIKYTINNADNLEGVTVAQATENGTLTFSVEGESEEESITLTFATPEGWDGYIISAPWAEVSEKEITKTRGAEDWAPIENYLGGMGYIKGNSVTFEIDGMDNFAEVLLYKGDEVYTASKIQINFNVMKAGGEIDDPAPAFPEFIPVSIFGEGLVDNQEINNGILTIKVMGESESDEVVVVLEVPEGWDGLISDAENVSEYTVGPRTRAGETEWQSIETLLAADWKKGNQFTFPADGLLHETMIRLYKGEQFDAAENNIISLQVTVSKIEEMPELPALPEKFDITVSSKDVEVWQGAYSDLKGFEMSAEDMEIVEMNQPRYAIVLSGETPDKTVTLTFNLPEGWAGVYPVEFLGAPQDEEENATRAEEETPWTESELMMLEDWKYNWMSGMFDTSMKEGTVFEYTVEDNQHVYFNWLYAPLSMYGEEFDAVDMSNMFLIIDNIKSKESSVGSIESVSAVRYYNLQGAEVANPQPGVYVKVANGKASKIVVK
ncbi:MAG: Ig-like domain-containing protein [Muribaculaceae bacterium]|nr:Ig-like domain-containing protein [Muribaculaceae bacterium]